MPEGLRNPTAYKNNSSVVALAAWDALRGFSERNYENL